MPRSSSASAACPRLARLLAWGLSAAALWLGLQPQPGQAQPVPADNPTLAAFGGRAGLGLLAQEFVQRLLADPRTGPFFKGVKQPELVKQLADQFCQLLDGPCRYEGKDMKKAHEEMEIRKADFNALVEVLQEAMEARGLGFADQNRLLAKLAPLHRETINAR